MIFIPNNVPSLKNSKTPVTLPGSKFTTLVPSKAVKKYLQKIGVKKYSGKKVWDYATRENIFRKAVGDEFKDVQYPAIVEFYFVRSSRRKFDFHNAVQIIADLLVAHGFIKDDDMDHFLPFPFQSKFDKNWYRVSKVEPGVYLRVKK